MLEQGCHRHADCGAQSYCRNSDDGRTFTCKRCAQWNPLRLSTSVTKMVPPACMALERERGIERGPCEELFASACPCSRHGCWRVTACTQSVWCEKSSGGDKGTLPGTVSAPATSATGLFNNESFPLHINSGHEDKQERLLLGLLRSLRAVKTTLPVHTMIFDGTLQKPSLLRLRRLGTRVLPIAPDAFRPPPWAMIKRRGTFAKLADAHAVEVVVWLDNDCRAVEANFTQMLADSCSLRVHDDAFIS